MAVSHLLLIPDHPLFYIEKNRLSDATSDK